MADSYMLKAIISAVDKLTPTLKVIQTQSAVARKYIGDLGKSVNGLASSFGVGAGILAGVAAGFGIGAIRKAVVGFAEVGEEVIKGARKAGMSTAEFQRMKYVAEQAGVPVDLLTASMGKLNKNMGAAAMGKDKNLAGLLTALKIPLRDTNGQVRRAADLLPQLADAFVKNDDPIKQAAMGTALFGKAYQDMLPFLNEGSDGINQSLARFAKLKGVIGEDDLKGAKEFGDRLADLSFITKGFQNTIAAQLVPVLSPLVDKLVLWAAANKKLIGAEVKQITQDLIALVTRVDWAGFLQGVRSTMSGITGFVESVGGLRNVLIGLVLYMNATTIASVIGLAGAFGRLALVAGGSLLGGLARLLPVLRATALAAMISLPSLGASLAAAALAAAPFVLAIAAVAGAAYLVWRNWDVVGPALAKVWDGIKVAGTYAFNALRLIWSWTPLGIVVNNWGAITGWLGVFWGQLRDVVGAGLALIDGLLQNWGVYDVLRAVWEPIVEFFRGVWDRIGSIVSTIARAAVAVGRGIGGFLDNNLGERASQQAFGPRFDGPGASPLLAQTPLALNGGAAQVGGAVVVSFKDAPPGMQIEQIKSDNSRVPIRTDVGHRFTAALGY